MIIIGEKLNSSIPSTLTFFENRDEAGILSLIQRQEQFGAKYLDINTAMCASEEDTLLWVLDLVKGHSNCGIMIDTADTEVMLKAAQKASGRDLILNSATIDERFQEVTSMAKQFDASLVALPISAEGTPFNWEEKCANLDALVQKLRFAGISDQQIYLDVLVETLAINMESGTSVVKAISHVAQNYPEIKTTCGLSNVSFGLPRRGVLNSAFLTVAVYAGLSSAIIDPTNRGMREALAAVELIKGTDDYCQNYIAAMRREEEGMCAK